MKKTFIFCIIVSLIVVACKKTEVDNTIPVIYLQGDTFMYVDLNSEYIEPGYTATDDIDGDITSKVKILGQVNPLVEADYILRYNVTDSAGNRAVEKSRKVRVIQF